MYGWRGRLGVVIPAVDASTEPEFSLMLPEGVSAHFQRFAFTGGGIDVFIKAKSSILDAIDIIKNINPSSLGLCCTAGSFAGGLGSDKALIDEIERRTGIPSTTASSAVVKALEKLGVNKITMVVPYIEEIAKVGEKFFQDNGLEIVNLKWLNKSGFGMHLISYEEIYQTVKEIDDTKSEAILISCAGLVTAKIIEKIEEDRCKPVITTNQALLWHMLRLSEINCKHGGYGRLFTL